MASLSAAGMKITIVTVAYNSAETITDTLRSVAGQLYGNIEHIVIDGGSQDDTLAIVQAEGSHVARIVNEADQGIYDAMNKGFALASGDFVGFLNADDMLAGPDVVAAIARAAGAANVDAVFGDLMYVNKDRPSELVRYWRSGAFARSRLRFGWMPPHPTLYVRAALVKSLGPFDLRFRIAADYDFMLRYLGWPGFQAVYLPKVLVKMRTGGASNKSMKSLARKSYEDWVALRQNRIGGLFTLFCKNARKLPQFFTKPR